jgi:DNA polymerase III epsilon subunit-like protein
MYPRGILTDVNELLTNSTIFAHNGIRFDRLFMNAELKRIGLKLLQPERFIDSAAVFKAWRMDILDWLDNRTFFEFANKVLEKRAYGVYFNLKFCCETLAIDITDLKAHRADADVIMTYRVIEALRKRLLKDEL